MTLFQFLGFICIPLVYGQEYFVDRKDGYTNVHGAISSPNTSTKYVIFLGIYSSTNDCISSCISYGNKISVNCSSYSYYTLDYPGNSSYKSHCYARFGYPLWNIMPANGINSGRIIYPCSSPIDCSLNGKCNSITNNCTCNIGWSGYKCNQLNLLPAKKESGYNTFNNTGYNTHNTSSWGGVVITDYNNPNSKTKYHMFISQIVNHCGLISWTLNSQIIHAVSTNGYNSPYELLEIVKLPFAHEPDIVYGNNGEFVLYYEHYTYDHISLCNCSDGTTTQTCKNNLPKVPQYQESMRYTNNISLPINEWSDEINIFNETNNDNTHDTNFAMVILKNGSLIGMSRQWVNGKGSLIYLSKATNWKDNTTYTMFEPDYKNRKLLFPELTKLYTEDPYLYTDCNGYYHAIFHNMSPNTANTTYHSNGYLGVCGGHAFSMDGINWIYAGSSYDNIIEYEDNTTFIAHSRERPHFIFADDNCTPIALTTGVTFGGQDASFTLLQPIKH